MLPQSGRPAPAIALDDLETGKRWELATAMDPSGQTCPRAVMLAFMASWCAYCAQSLPTLAELEADNPELSVVTVTVDSTPEAQRKELDKVRKAGLTGPVLAADSAAIGTWIGGDRSVPKYYFVNYNGVLVAKDDGFGDKVRPMMPGQVLRALGGRSETP
jgi:thiol-disulfide isomerase/thioredoxin